MKKIIIALLVVSIFSCKGKDPVVKSIPAKDFIDSTRTAQNIQIVDVRTAQEFTQGNLPKSINADFNSADFKERIAILDKKKPVYIYCLSGERSSGSIEAFKEAGFEMIYTMEGGVLALNNTNPKVAPSNNAPPTAATVTITQYDEFLKNNKNVIVDFYADWCGPCKMMAPHLEQLEKDNAGKVKILKVNTDHSRELAAKYKISSIPRLFVVKDGKVVDDILGFDARNIEAFKQRLMKAF